MNYLSAMVIIISAHIFVSDFSSQPIEGINQGISIMTVGNDTECDHPSINAAISVAANETVDEIRIMTNTYSENILIDDLDLVLRGGYANCIDALNGISDGQKVIVQAQDTAPTLVLTSSGNRNNVLIENMVFTNGTGGGFPFSFLKGGGITTLAANLDLKLIDVVVKNNTGTAGGGIAIQGGNTDITGINLQISDNNATQGGGLFCNGVDASIILSDTGVLSSGIYNNEATNGSGGGVFLTEECSFTSYSGGDATVDDKRGISFNQATVHGGGISVEAGGKLLLAGSKVCDDNGHCLGNNDFPININNNSADSNNDGIGDGGGIYVSASSTFGLSVNISHNQAENGGAFYAIDYSIMQFGYFDESCWNVKRCNQFTNNRANLGGVFYALNDSNIVLYNSHIKSNNANEGVVGWLEQSIDVNLISNIIYANGDRNLEYENNNLFRISNNSGSLLIRSSTIVDNLVDTIIVNESIVRAISSVWLLASIIHNPTVAIYDCNGCGINACLVVNEDVTLTGDNIILSDPEFVNRAAHDYHIKLNSPAVDMCRNPIIITGFPEPIWLPAKDIDLQLRDFDYPGIKNINGAYDAGADEINDRIFANSFDPNDY